MRLTQRLFSYLNRVFDKDPLQFMALRLRYNGGLVWSVADGVLTTRVTGGSGVNLSIALSGYTLAQLVAFLAAQPGYSVAYADTTPLINLSSLTLIDGSGDIGQNNGDHLNGYTSVLWSYIESASSELETAQGQIGQMLAQMSTNTAAAEWLDELGGYYGVPRLQGELDAQYGPRIIATVLRPLGNNVAIESALRVLNSGLSAKVTDVNVLTNNSYGRFDVDFSVSLAMLAVSSPAAWTAAITKTIDVMRDAGTFLRSITINTPVQATNYFGGVVFSGDTVRVYPGP